MAASIPWLLDLPIRAARAVTRRVKHYEVVRANASGAIDMLARAEVELDTTRDVLAIAVPALQALTFPIKGTAYRDGKPRLIIAKSKKRVLVNGDELFVYDPVSRAVRAVFEVTDTSVDYEITPKRIMDGLWGGALRDRAMNGDSSPPDNTVAIVRREA